MDKKEKAKSVKIETLYRGQLKKIGGDKLTGFCPFHKDTDKTNPNFFIYLKTNTWYCFVCRKGGDAIAFYMQWSGVDFKTAIKELR